MSYRGITPVLTCNACPDPSNGLSPSNWNGLTAIITMTSTFPGRLKGSGKVHRVFHGVINLILDSAVSRPPAGHYDVSFAVRHPSSLATFAKPRTADAAAILASWR